MVEKRILWASSNVWWTGIPLTCSEAELILLLALIVVECPDSHTSIRVFIEGVPAVHVAACIGACLVYGGCVFLVCLITADAAKMNFT